MQLTSNPELQQIIKDAIAAHAGPTATRQTAVNAVANGLVALIKMWREIAGLPGDGPEPTQTELKTMIDEIYRVADAN